MSNAAQAGIRPNGAGRVADFAPTYGALAALLLLLVIKAAIIVVAVYIQRPKAV